MQLNSGTLTSQEISAFFEAPALAELTERLKTSDNLLEIIKLKETQHSAVMAWMFDPREGHGQGEEILRDFLLQASSAAQNQLSSEGGIGLKNESTTRIFFDYWNVPRLKTAALGGCFIATEYEVGGKRLDLLVVDPVNKFVVVIENKAGATLTDVQLNCYYQLVSPMVENKTINKQRFEGFKLAFVALDQNFEEYSDENETQTAASIEKSKSGLKTSLDNWIAINYEWLEVSANRATLHIQRGNSAARLIENYCMQQTAWASGSDARTLELGSILWESHLKVVAYLCQPQLAHRPAKAWAELEFNNTKIKAKLADAEHLLLFSAQNKSLINALRKTTSLSTVRWRIEKSNPLLIGLVKSARLGIRVWLSTERLWPGISGLQGPLFLSAREMRREGKSGKFRIKLIWDSKFLNDSIDEDGKAIYRELIVSKLQSSNDNSIKKSGDSEKNIFSSMEKNKNSTARRIILKSDLNYTDLAHELLELEKKISSILKDINFSSVSSQVTI